MSSSIHSLITKLSLKSLLNTTFQPHQWNGYIQFFFFWHVMKIKCTTDISWNSECCQNGSFKKKLVKFSLIYNQKSLSCRAPTLSTERNPVMEKTFRLYAYFGVPIWLLTLLWVSCFSHRKCDCWARALPGFNSRVGQSAIGFLHQEFINCSHGVWFCAQLMVTGSSSSTWKLTT